MGSSNSVVFKYKDHCLEQKNNNYYWVYYRDGTERARMEVSVEKKIINPGTRQNSFFFNPNQPHEGSVIGNLDSYQGLTGQRLACDQHRRQSMGSLSYEMGPLIYTTDDHSNDWIVYKNYLPTDSKPINKEKPLIYYKLTSDSLWSKIFYVLGTTPLSF